MLAPLRDQVRWGNLVLACHCGVVEMLDWRLGDVRRGVTVSIEIVASSERVFVLDRCRSPPVSGTHVVVVVNWCQ